MVSNVLCVAMIALCVTAVGGEITPLGCVQICLATSLASLIPLVPGQVGTLESAFVVAALHLGMAAPVALAAAVLFHVAVVAPAALAGLPLLVRLRWEAKPCA